MKPVHGESGKVLCDVCLSNFSVSHGGGKYDVKRHRQCEPHKKSVVQKEASQSMHTGKLHLNKLLRFYLQAVMCY